MNAARRLTFARLISLSGGSAAYNPPAPPPRWSESGYVALAGMAVAGGGRGLADVAAVTLIQRHAPDEVRSRVFAAQEGAAHIAFSVSAFSGGLLVSAEGARFAFAAAAVASLCASGVSTFGRSR